MKAQAFLLVVSAAVAACSSDPQAPNPGTTTGGGGQVGVAGASSAGVGGSLAGAPAAGGSSPGASGSAVGGGSGAGTTAGASGGGAGGAGGGSGGTGGSGGSAGTPDPGTGPNMIPQGYTGTPFGGTPQTIPGKIEIEKYDLGGAGVAYQAEAGGAFNKCGFMRTDALKLQCTGQEGPDDKALPGCGDEPDGSVYLGYIGAGNWYKYTVNVLEAGTYVISGHEGVAGNTQMKFAFTDAVATGNITLPSTDQCGHEAYHVWAVHDNLGEIALQPGKYVLTITSVAAAMNLDWFAFTKK